MSGTAAAAANDMNGRLKKVDHGCLVQYYHCVNIFRNFFAAHRSVINKCKHSCKILFRASSMRAANVYRLAATRSIDS